MSPPPRDLFGSSILATWHNFKTTYRFRLPNGPFAEAAKVNPDARWATSPPSRSPSIHCVSNVGNNNGAVRSTRGAVPPGPWLNPLRLARCPKYPTTTKKPSKNIASQSPARSGTPGRKTTGNDAAVRSPQKAVSFNTGYITQLFTYPRLAPHPAMHYMPCGVLRFAKFFNIFYQLHN